MISLSEPANEKVHDLPRMKFALRSKIHRLHVRIEKMQKHPKCVPGRVGYFKMTVKLNQMKKYQTELILLGETYVSTNARGTSGSSW